MESNVPGLGASDDDMDTTPNVEDTAQPQPQPASDSADVETGTGAEMEPRQAQETDMTQAAPTSINDETPAAAEPEAAESPVQASEAPASAEGTASGLKVGMVVEGTITGTSPTQITVDVGAEVPGIIPGEELEKLSRNVLDALREGEKVMVYILNTQITNRNAILLSINKAMEEQDWVRAEEYRQSQQVFETRVAGYNKGGLIVRFGRVRGFVPQSQMSAERRQALGGETPEERWGKMVNEPISVKVMEVDHGRNRLILSERSASRESREKRKEMLISQLKVGEVRTGRVVSLEDFGAFVDIGGAEGLVHLTELSWKHVTHPKDLLKQGQEVRVQVISIDRENKRIGLSMKRQEPDPWDTVAINYNEGQLVRAEVTKLTKFGAFARLVDVPEIEGLIHISELSDRRVTHPREVVNEGDILTLRVVKINIPERRLGLSLKKVNSAEYLDQDWANFAASPSPSGSSAGTPEPEDSEAEAPPSEESGDGAGDEANGTGET